MRFKKVTEYHILDEENFFPAGDVYHTPERCAGGHWCYHNPSEHRMDKWPLRTAKCGIAARLCQHGLPHPDPDAITWVKDVASPSSIGSAIKSFHSECDGCCIET